jgi:TetR/AcrR family transcriptional regulator, mexJK operon transcriptional repressor
MSVTSAIAACPDRILDAALDVFCEHGYRASIDAVASRANVARQTIYNHFGSKEALFGAALEKAIAELFSEVRASDGELRDRLIRFGLALRARALSPESIKLQRVLIGEAPRFTELAESFFKTCFLGSYAQMSAVFEKAMREGRLRRDDPVEMARLFMEMLVGLDRWRMLYGGTTPPAGGEKKHVTRVVDFFMRAYAVTSLKSVGIQR